MPPPVDGMKTLRHALAALVAAMPTGNGHPTEAERDALVEQLRTEETNG